MIKQCSLKEVYLCIRFCWIGPRSCLDDCQKPKYDNVDLIRNLWTPSPWPNFGSYTAQVSPEIPQASFTSNRPLWRNLNSLDNCDNYYHTFIVWICQMKKSVLKYFYYTSSLKYTIFPLNSSSFILRFLSWKLDEGLQKVNISISIPTHLLHLSISAIFAEKYR